MIRCQHCGAENAGDARFCGVCGRATSATEPSSAGGFAPPGGAAPDWVGREIGGRYRVVAKLGEGGMGAVYRGEQISLKRRVAIKVLHPELSANPALVRRFNTEAELAAKLSHPSTVNIYDFGQDGDGTLFIAMEFLEGRSLRQVVTAEGPLPLRRALHIAAQVAASIADAHQHGIVHRDLKPDNVMLTERGRDRDVVRVLDFGIAKLRDEQHQAQTQNPMTRQGDLVGTPQYMAPEQIRGEPVDGRTDVYALGTILYEMVTGRMPFEGASLMAILSKHLTETAEPPSRRRPDLGLPAALDALVMEMLAKAPAARPASMDAVGERIAHLAATAATLPGGVPYGTPPRVARPPGVPITLPPGQMMAPPTQQQPMPVTMPVAQSFAQPPMPVPQPFPPQPPRSGSLLWLWILLAVIGAGGVLAAVIALSSGSEPAEPSAAADPAARPAAPAAPAAAAGGERVRVGGYELVLPLGFIEAATGAELDDVDAHSYVGTIDGNLVGLHVLASAEDLSAAGVAELDDGCGDIARAYFSGELNASRPVTGHGAQRYRCTIAGGGQAIEGAFYTGAAGTLVVFFATDPGAFDALRGARDDLFDRRIATSSSR